MTDTMSNSAVGDAAPGVGGTAADINPFFAANLEAFRKHAPAVIAKLSRTREPLSRLIVDDNGDIDVDFFGQRLYGKDAVAFAEKQLATYFAAPDRRYISRPSSVKLPGITAEFIDEIVTQGAEKGWKISEERCAASAHFALIFGLGLGLHLEPLVRHTECRCLIIVEPNIENLHHSLFVTDWVSLFEEAEKNGRSIYFVFDRDQELISANIRTHIMNGNPGLLDGAYVYRHYVSSILTGAYDSFNRDQFLFVAGLGFFEDEILMLANAVVNMAHPEARLLSTVMERREHPIFLCGSGPSLDDDLDVIAAHTDRAIIVSLGSCLRSLLASGIRPDFHIELENHPLNARAVRLVDEEFDLSGITLLASSTVPPEVTGRFNDVIYFFRDLASPTLMFGRGIDAMQSSGPTVANSGLITSLTMGFHNLYLFGVDMGTRSPDHYHARSSNVGQGKSPEWASHWGNRLPANFGGGAYVDPILNWSRTAFENVLRFFPQAKCWNCSDGLRIKGTRPLLSRALQLKNAPIDRVALRQSLRDAMSKFNIAQVRDVWAHSEDSDATAAIAGKIMASFDSVESQGGQAIQWLNEIHKLVEERTGGAPAINAFLYGTTVMLCNIYWWFDGRIDNEDDREEYRRVASRCLKKLYASMFDRYGELSGDIESFFAGDTGALAHWDEDSGV